MNTETEIWFKCQTCGDVSKNPIECCGEMMERDEDFEQEEFQNFILEEESDYRGKKYF